MNGNSILQSILEVAPKNESGKDEFVSHFNHETNNFDRPDKLPNYLDTLWVNIENELGKSKFLGSTFFDFKQLKFGGRVVQFRFWILIMFFAEFTIFLGWLYKSYSCDEVFEKTFVSGYWLQILFVSLFIHAHLVLKNRLTEYYFRRREADFQKRVKSVLARCYNGPRISVRIGDAGAWILFRNLDKFK